MRLLAITCVAVVLALAAKADESRLRSLESADDGREWNAVGKLMLGDRGFCTGTLIRPDVVLTAGHCLFDRDTGARIDEGGIEFRAGWRNGRAVAYRHVRRAVVHPAYIFGVADAAGRVAHDVAVLELDQPIRLPSVSPFRIDAPPLGRGQVGVVSYAQGRSEAPSLQEICTVLGRMPGTLVLSCSVDFGASGAPVFTMHDGQPSIVSVVSAKAEMDGRPISLASDIGAPLRDVLADLDAGGGQVRQIRTGVHILSGGGGGARFLRPEAP